MLHNIVRINEHIKLIMHLYKEVLFCIIIYVLENDFETYIVILLFCSILYSWKKTKIFKINIT